MSSQTVLSDILASLVSKKILNESYGILLKDLPKFSYQHFLEYLEMRIIENGLTSPNVFFVGFSKEELKDLHKEIDYPFCKIQLHYSVEKAEDFRNDRDVEGMRIVIVKRAVPKLSSLHWYELITAHAIYKELCITAEKHLGGINDSLKIIWKSLNSKEIMGIISLERIIDYYQQLTLNDENITSDAVNHLYRLGLLVDESLFVKNNVESLRQRLIENSKLVSRISNLNNNKEDRKALQSNPDSEIYHSTRSNILKFYSTRDISVLGQMKYHEVLKLLSKIKKDQFKNKKPLEGMILEIEDTRNKRKVTSSDAKAVDLILENDTERVKGLLEDIEKEYSEWEKGKRSKVEVKNEGEGTRVEFIPEIINLINTFVGENAYGGIIRASVKNPADALRSIGQFKIRIFNSSYIDEIRRILQQFENEFKEVKGLLDIFNTFLVTRNNLVSASHRLADSPMLKIVENEEIQNNCISYIKSYERLLKKIKEYYALFASFSPRGSKQLIASLNSMDMVYIIGEDTVHSTMTPLYPLYLWKYIELTARIKESSSNLNDIDKDFLVRKSEEIPNPLSTIFISNFISNKGDTVIPEVSFLGNLPLYSSEQQINQTTDGLEVIENSLKKFIKVYPHSSFGIRVAFVNPPSVKHVLDLFKSLLKNNDSTIQGAHIHIYKTKETPENWASFDEVDDIIHNKFALSNDPNFSVKIENSVIGFGELVNSIKKNHFHSVVMFDPCGKSVSNMRRNPLLKINPLCIPKVFEYDPIADRVEILSASEGNIFSDHHDLIARLIDKPQGWHHTVILELETNKNEFEELLKSTQWLIIAEANLKKLELSVVGSENCIYYQSKSFRDVGIYSKDWTKLTKGMEQSIRSIGNYNTNKECVAQVLRKIQSLNEKGVLQLASSKIDKTFNLNHTKGALGTAISALWTTQSSKNYILVSLDTDISLNLLDERESCAFSELVGISFDGHQATIDIIEVKTYKGAYHTEENEIRGKAVEQINSVRQIFNEIFSERDKITSPSRRELLRFQVFKALYQLPLSKSDKKEWTYHLNRLFAGEIPVLINSYIHHIRFSEQGLATTKQYDSDYKINLVEIRDDFINKVLVNCGEIQYESIYENLAFKDTKSVQLLPSEPSTNGDSSNKVNININSADIIETKTNKTNDGKSSDLNLGVDKVETHIRNDDIDFFKCDKNNEINDIVKISDALYRAMRDYSIDVSSVDPELALIASRFIRFRVRLRPGETLQKVLRYRTDISREIEAEFDILVGNERGTQFVYVDVPRKSSEPIKLLDYLDKLENDQPVGSLNAVIGLDPSGEFRQLNIAQAHHLLTVGSIGSGKTIFLYSLIVSLISQYSPENLEIVIIDPKQTDFIFFDGLPHLRNGAVILDAEKAVKILTDLAELELERRTDLLRKSRSRDIFSYNQKNADAPIKPIVVIIDEYADLIQVADLEGRKKDFERQMIRLAQRSGNVGIHLVVATQRPSGDIVTSNLKTNIPCRISFRLPAHQDSMTILDTPGAMDLLGKGDMLFSLNGELIRLQGLFISEEELEGYLEKYI
ncbi:hypothetical protein GW626_01490 [Peribacillus muralis]|uniref:FtsK/SpoIIIE domain-containing protein n=1 Tax=Peribacillus muralis TaxID=264697 RepID=UPI001F4E465A|nr:FtsK/SpoIIIE domain-containing protein [Peribacillus muralis]MCK1994908.1 hypothetical protein [Peribacillus muralis]MCK2015546.1 hypothetical protein [Peribacillus muralis]